ncbi:hypothetical protein SE91_05830 [Bradyrhizobium sp. DOA1]|nr:hypothetical protein SE91_05830 [Bradyrhizobium sp. DOA1]
MVEELLVVCSARDALKLPIKQFSIKVRDDIFQSGGFDGHALGTELMFKYATPCWIIHHKFAHNHTL